MSSNPYEKIMEALKELPAIAEAVKLIPLLVEAVKPIPELVEAVKPIPELVEAVKPIPELVEGQQRLEVRMQIMQQEIRAIREQTALNAELFSIVGHLQEQ